MSPKILAAISSHWGIIAAAVMFSAALALATPPQVVNMLASQRSGTKLVDITYTLSNDTPSCAVSVSVSTNNGATYNLTATNFSGNGYGSNVIPGLLRLIVWDAGADWEGHYSTQVWFKATALERNTNELTNTAPSFLSDYIGTFDTVIPNPGYGGGYEWTASWYISNCKLLGYWQFNYCTD